MTEQTDFFTLAADLARLEAATRRAERLRYVAMLRQVFPPDRNDAPLTSEGERVRACRDAGVDPYGEL